MKYEELISQLCEVIKESENNAQLIYDSAEIIDSINTSLDIPLHKKEKSKNWTFRWSCTIRCCSFGSRKRIGNQRF